MSVQLRIEMEIECTDDLATEPDVLCYLLKDRINNVPTTYNPITCIRVKSMHEDPTIKKDA